MVGKKVIYIIISVIMLFFIGIISISYAMTNIEEYSIKKSEEDEFLNRMYNIVDETKEIKSITKEISSDNYATKEIYKTKTLNKKTEEYIYEQFGKTYKFKDEEYVGTLEIVDIDIQTINNGYYEKIDEKQIIFNNYNENDLNDVAKEIKLDGRTYYLINVIWEPETTNLIDGQEVPILYKGTQIYQTINKIQNPNTYEITVTYSGNVEKIDTLYKYEIVFESIEKTTNNKTPFIISGIGMVGAIILVIRKNTYIYSKTQKGYKLIKRTNINNRKLSIDITKCKNRNYEDIYAIKIKKGTLKRLKGRTISLVLGNKKKDIILWNNYYEIKL